MVSLYLSHRRGAFRAEAGGGGGGWDVSLAAYEAKAADVSGQESSPAAVAFSSDGSKMYVVGTSSDSVHQYALSTPWDVSTATYESKAADVSGQAANPRGLAFSADGTAMYVLENVDSPVSVYQYALSTPWDVSTASYDAKSADVSGQEIFPQGIFFKPDGSVMYMVGSGDTVYQYELSTPWDVSTATYSSTSKSVAAEESSTTSVFFKPDGTKMYVVGSSDDTVYQYALSTPWDVSTATYESKAADVSGQETLPQGVAFSSDGTKMYVVGFSDSVYQYAL